VPGIDAADHRKLNISLSAHTMAQVAFKRSRLEYTQRRKGTRILTDLRNYTEHVMNDSWRFVFQISSPSASRGRFEKSDGDAGNAARPGKIGFSISRGEVEFRKIEVWER